MKENFRLICEELFGGRVDHPLIRRALAFAFDFLIISLIEVAFLYVVNKNQKEIEYHILIMIVPSWIIYLTLCNSKIFNGQTPGKKIFRIRVVDANGQHLGFIKSFVRALLILILISRLELMYFIVTKHHSLRIPAITALTAILVGAIYFPLLRTERQALHDLLVRSQVVSLDRDIKIKNKVSWISLLIFIVITVSAMALIVK